VGLLDEDEKPVISILDKKGLPLLRLEADKYTQPQLILHDKNGKGGIFLGISPNGSSSVNFFDSRGDNSLQLESGIGKLPMILMFDKEKKPRLRIGAKDEPLILIVDDNGKQLWSAP